MERPATAGQAHIVRRQRNPEANSIVHPPTGLPECLPSASYSCGSEILGTIKDCVGRDWLPSSSSFLMSIKPTCRQSGSNNPQICALKSAATFRFNHEGLFARLSLGSCKANMACKLPFQKSRAHASVPPQLPIARNFGEQFASCAKTATTLGISLGSVLLTFYRASPSALCGEFATPVRVERCNVSSASAQEC